MKKAKFLPLVLAAFLLAGCGSSSTPTSGSDSVSDTSASDTSATNDTSTTSDESSDISSEEPQATSWAEITNATDILELYGIDSAILPFLYKEGLIWGIGYDSSYNFCFYTSSLPTGSTTLDISNEYIRLLLAGGWAYGGSSSSYNLYNYTVENEDGSSTISSIVTAYDSDYFYIWLEETTTSKPNAVSEWVDSKFTAGVNNYTMDTVITATAYLATYDETAGGYTYDPSSIYANYGSYAVDSRYTAEGFYENYVYTDPDTAETSGIGATYIANTSSGISIYQSTDGTTWGTATSYSGDYTSWVDVMYSMGDLVNALGVLTATDDANIFTCTDSTIIATIADFFALTFDQTNGNQPGDVFTFTLDEEANTLTIDGALHARLYYADSSRTTVIYIEYAAHIVINNIGTTTLSDITLPTA